MPAYAYRALHISGRVARGEMAAANENELAHYLSESGLELIHAQEKRARIQYRALNRKRIAPRVVFSFYNRLHDLLQAGLPFAEALQDCATTTDNRILADALTQIVRSIGNGNGIASSFSVYPLLFPPVYVAIIGAGERSGDMREIFAFLARYAEASARTQENLRRALRYPLFLLLVAGGAVGFMMSMVVPQLVQFLNGLQAHLPLVTRMLIGFSLLFSHYGLYLLLGAALAVTGVIVARRSFPGFAIFCDDLLLRLPFIGPVITKTSLARFTHSFAILFRSGCEAPACLRQAGATIGNRSLRFGVEVAEQRLVAGTALSQALSGIMPSFAVGLLRTGERSGNLAKSLDDITAAYEREALAATDHFMGLLEPCLTLAIGGLLAWTVMAVLGPLYGSLTVLGGRM